MRIVLFVIMLALVASVWLTVDFAALAQGNDPNVVMLDNCSTSDPEYAPFGGCPEGGPAPQYKGDVTVTEFFALLTTPLAPPGHIIGHPSWRNEPSYITINAGQKVRVPNRGGRVHSFTEVAEFGGGFIPPLNGALAPTPECNTSPPAPFVPDPAVVFVGVGQTQEIQGLSPGLHKFQCCIHPWMRAAIRVN